MSDPDRIGRYETIRLLGRGGMGAVYLARDPLIDRLVAIKVLSRDFEAPARQRFTREARASGRLQHENIATIFDVGEHLGTPFIAMEYVEGQTLGHVVRHHVPLTPSDTLRLLEDACAGLAFAHRAGVVHLDVKPDNLMRRHDGRLKILDFGIARVIAGEETHTRHVLGTLAYMSPEQLHGREVDHRSDVFGLGCVLYELVARTPAFSGTVAEVVSRIDGGVVTPLSVVIPGVHPALVRMCDRAMAHEPSDRYDDLEELRRELASLRREVAGATGAVLTADGEEASRATTAAAPKTVLRSAATTDPLPGENRMRRKFEGGRGMALAGVGVLSVALASGVVWSKRTPAPEAERPAAESALPVAPAAAEPTENAPPPASDSTPATPATPDAATRGRDLTAGRPAESTAQRAEPMPRVPPPVSTSGANRAVTESPARPTPPPVVPELPVPAAKEPVAAPPEPPPGSARSDGAATPEKSAPPASPPPRAPASVERPSAQPPERAVEDVLGAYAASYGRRDVAAIQRVFPALPADQAAAIATTFAGANSYRMDIRVLDVTVNGAAATATCDVTHVLVPKVGNTSSNVLRSLFHLRRTDGGWVIERIDRTAVR